MEKRPPRKKKMTGQGQMSIEVAIKAGLETIESTPVKVGVGIDLEIARDTPITIGVEAGVGEGTMESIPAAPKTEIALP